MPYAAYAICQDYPLHAIVIANFFSTVIRSSLPSSLAPTTRHSIEPLLCQDKKLLQLTPELQYLTVEQTSPPDTSSFSNN